MERLLETIEGSAIYAFLRTLDRTLWETWQGSLIGRAVESLAALVRQSLLARLFVGIDGRPSALAGWLRGRLGAEGTLAPAKPFEIYGIYFIVLFVPIELWLITKLPSSLKYLGDVALLLLLVSLLVRLMQAKWPLRRTPADAAAVLLLGAAILSTLLNFVPLHIALFGTRAYLEYYALYLVLAYLPWADNERRQLIIWFLVLAAAIALLGDAQKLLHVATPRQWLSAVEAQTTRAFGTMNNPNTFGGFLVWALALFFSLLFTRVRGGLRVLALAGILLALPALVFTLSREALVAFAAGALLIGVAVDRRFLLLLIGGALLLPILDPHLVQRFAFAFSQNYVATSSTYGRLLFWTRGLEAFLTKPILGWGPGRFGGSVAHLYGSPVYVLYGISFQPVIDSQHVQTLVELGLVGYLAYLWLGLAAVRAGLRLFRQDQDPFWRAMGLALAAGTVGFFVQSFFASLLETHQVVMVFWLIFGMVAWRLGRAKAGVAREAPIGES